jgi:hypothetical protein
MVDSTGNYFLYLSILGVKSMGMSMRLGHGMSLEQSLALEMRQTLEQRLYQSLTVIQLVRLELSLYREREQAFTRLYEKALNTGKVRTYNKHGLNFEYALVSVNDLPKSFEGNLEMAFSHCLYDKLEAELFGKLYALARGSWLLFVVEDMYPSIPFEWLELACMRKESRLHWETIILHRGLNLQ